MVYKDIHIVLYNIERFEKRTTSTVPPIHPFSDPQGFIGGTSLTHCTISPHEFFHAIVGIGHWAPSSSRTISGTSNRMESF